MGRCTAHHDITKILFKKGIKHHTTDNVIADSSTVTSETKTDMAENDLDENVKEKERSNTPEDKPSEVTEEDQPVHITPPTIEEVNKLLCPLYFSLHAII